MEPCVVCGQPVGEDRTPPWCNASISADPDGWARAKAPDPDGQARADHMMEVMLLDALWPKEHSGLVKIL